MDLRPNSRSGSLATLARASLATAVVVALLLIPARTSLAQTPMDPLEFFYQRLLAAVEWQANYLEVAEQLAERSQEWIDDLKGKGQDTSQIEEALKAFKARLEEAESLHNQAVQILAEHEGFDDDGKVIDRMKALKTLREAATALREAQVALWTGTMNLRGITGTWRRHHQPWLRGQ